MFVHLILKTYVPDELSGLVDALADPRAYLSAQEKRKEALHHMGVDESDIIEIIPTSNNNNNNNVTSNSNQNIQRSDNSSITNALLQRQQKQNGIMQTFE